MITILSWNIQNGQGVDGIVSLDRIANTILEMCDPDIICLQEVSINCKLLDGSRPDQVKQLSNLFSDYKPFFGPAYDIQGDGGEGREKYGNLILSRVPVLSFFNHKLPRLVGSSIRQMPRQLIEITVQTPLFPLCIMTTHLEYHSETQRYAQLKRILSINKEINNLTKFPPLFDTNGPYAKLERSNNFVICGDFNFLPKSIEYDLLTSDKENLEPLMDAWKLVNPNSIHTPTCGIFDKKQWREGPHCRDFAFISSNIKDNVDNIFVNVETDASDHQPVILTLSNPNIL